MTPDLSKLTTPRPRMTPEFAKLRKDEQVRRRAAAVHLANRALARLHPDDFAELLRQAKEAVNAKRGPLPGD